MRHRALALILALVCGRASLAQDQPPAPDAATTYAARLAALDPASPSAYLELAEEIADARRDPSGRKLATELYVLAYSLDLRNGDSNPAAASACLGLAAHPGSARYAPWLRALTQRLSPATPRPEWGRSPGSGGGDSLAYQLALLLGYARFGEGGFARQLLARTDLSSALDTIDRLLVQLGVLDGATGVRREASRWPCPDCGNDRVIRRAQTSPPTWRFCTLCGGLPGERISNAELLAYLRAESFLLEGVQKSWAAQITTDQGAPLIDPDPDSLPSVFGIDPARTAFKDGRWVKPG